MITHVHLSFAAAIHRRLSRAKQPGARPVLPRRPQRGLSFLMKYSPNDLPEPCCSNHSQGKHWSDECAPALHVGVFKEALAQRGTRVAYNVVISQRWVYKPNVMLWIIFRFNGYCKYCSGTRRHACSKNPSVEVLLFCQGRSLAWNSVWKVFKKEATGELMSGLV